jgi:cobalt-zinc-cadmium efflux system membrane fusion protein
VEVYVSVGSAVSRETNLALLDSTELGEAKAEHLKAKTFLDLAKANYEREKTLFDQKIAAKKDVLTAEAEYRKVEAELRSLEEKLRLYGLSDKEIADMEHSQSASRYYLRSPAPGIVTEKEITLGEVIETGKKVFTISDLSNVWIYLDIYERDLSKIKVGQKATVRVGGYPEKAFVGKVAYLSGLMDEKTKTLKARVEIANPDRLLKPGMFAEARIETGTGAERKITVPKEAVFLLDEGPVVFIEKDGGFFPRRVETGKEAGGRVEILNGISEGEKVVVEGGYYLKAEILKSQMGEG